MNTSNVNRNAFSTGECPQCGIVHAGTGRVGHLCPACLLRQGLTTDTSFEKKAGNGSDFVPSLPDHDKIVRSFPQFEILDCLGRGGMGVVYRARQRSLDRIVALKIIAPERQTEPEFADRFAREAKTLARINHPGIVTIYDFGESQGIFFIAMEFVDGPTVRDLIDRKHIRPGEVVSMAASVCEALHYAHAHGVVHRDIKPENLLLAPHGGIKIADFGIARMLRPGTGLGDPRQPCENVAGTPRYMAPEQRSRPASVDHRADLYSLGVVFHELLTGEIPVQESSLSGTPDVQPILGSDLRSVTARAVAPDPGNRYSTAEEMLAALRSVALSKSDQSEWPRGERESRTWRSLFVGFLAVAALAFFLVHQDRGPARNSVESPAATTPTKNKGIPRIDRAAAFVLTPDENENPSEVHLDIRGQLDGSAWIAGREVADEFDIQVFRPLASGTDFHFEYFPGTATEGDLSITYRFRD